MEKPEEISFVLVTGTGGMIFLALLVIIFIVVYQRKMFAKQNQLKTLELESQKQLVEATIQVKEREQKRVAQELHDDIGASLTAVRFMLQRVDDSTEVKPELISALSEITKKVRRISNDLLPSVLEEFGLQEAINDLVDGFNRSAPVKINFSCEYYTISFLKKDIELSLFRIVQELMNNILKYAEATEVSIKLSNTPKQIEIVIVDNGNGVIPDKEVFTKSLGLKNIESRLQYINGSMQREKNEPKGTIVTIIKPTYE